jgi:uncharacterized protein (DUF488 family)
MIIYTIGTSNREIEEFIELLNAYGIKTLGDVRRFPTSKFEWFKNENLVKALAGQGIRYVFLGDELGGYRKGGYKAYTETQNYRRGLEKIEALASNKKVVVMCSERLPWKCHRRFIGKSLQDREWEVVHIIEKEKIWKPKM